MSKNIVTLISEQFAGSVIDAARNMTGLGADDADRSVRAAVPAMLSGILGATGSQSGKDALEAALSRQGNVDDLAGVLALELLAELLHLIDSLGVVDDTANIGLNVGLLPRAGDVHGDLEPRQVAQVDAGAAELVALDVLSSHRSGPGRRRCPTRVVIAPG